MIKNDQFNLIFTIPFFCIHVQYLGHTHGKFFPLKVKFILANYFYLLTLKTLGRNQGSYTKMKKQMDTGVGNQWSLAPDAMKCYPAVRRKTGL